MASNPDFVQYITDQCAGAGNIATRKMFGDYGIYCDGKFNSCVARICVRHTLAQNHTFI